MSEQMGFKTKLQKIQYELKAPKNLFNKFGNYKYRNAEGILEAVKPLLDKYKCILKVEDDIVLVGDRYYVKAIATLVDCESDAEISNVALAREDTTKSGMSESQVTGATSSYARKYCLNGLFLLDDTKDADSEEYHNETEAKAKQMPKETPKPQTPKQPSREATDKQKIGEVELHGLLSEAGDKGVTVEQLKQAVGVQRLEDCTKEQFDKLMNKLAKTPSAKEKSNGK